MADKRINNSGKRKGRQKKVPITIYKPLAEVDKMGGIVVARYTCSNAFDEKVTNILMKEINTI